MLYIDRKYMEQRGFHIRIEEEFIAIEAPLLKPIGKELKQLTDLNDANIDAACTFLNKLQVVQAIMEQ